MQSTLNLLRTLSDPTRARLMNLLQSEELSVAEIQEILGMGQSRISTHLAQLKRAGLVQDRRVGKNNYYSWSPAGPIKEPELRSLIGLAIADLPEATSDQSSLKHVIAKRKNRTREYFNKLAGKFGRSYCPGRSWQALAYFFLSTMPPIDVADLGLGDLEEPPIAENSIDLAIFSQALHHANSPQKAMAAAGKILRPGGQVVILDLLAHGFEQARDLYADLWLGFSEVELVHLLEQAGFREIEVQVVSKEINSPHFQTVLATGVK